MNIHWRQGSILYLILLDFKCSIKVCLLSMWVIIGVKPSWIWGFGEIDSWSVARTYFKLVYGWNYFKIFYNFMELYNFYAQILKKMCWMRTSGLLDFISEDFRGGLVKYFRIYLFLTFGFILDLYICDILCCTVMYCVWCFCQWCDISWGMWCTVVFLSVMHLYTIIHWNYMYIDLYIPIGFIGF